jgi:hypothetical protein
MLNFMSRARSVPHNQNPNTFFEAVRDIHFIAAQDSDIHPAKLARGDGGVFSVQIGGGGYEHAADVVGIDLVGGDQGGEQFVRGGEDSFAGIGGGGGGSAYTPAANGLVGWCGKTQGTALLFAETKKGAELFALRPLSFGSLTWQNVSSDPPCGPRNKNRNQKTSPCW